MSLTSHLADPNSPIGQFIKQHFAQTLRLTKATNQELKKVPITAFLTALTEDSSVSLASLRQAFRTLLQEED